jgi:hypothetical protein
MTEAGQRRAVVGVFPASERTRRRRLLDALEKAYPVRFEGRSAGACRGLDSLIAFDKASAPTSDLPLARLIYAGEETAPRQAKAVVLADHPALARPLQGSRLTETRAGAFEPAPVGGAEAVLATVDASPVWTLLEGPAMPRHHVALAPPELGVDESLRSRLAPGRCVAMLALAQYLRDLTTGRRWELPSPRAAFVIDDPNLRKPRYGHIDYARLLSSARTHDYHVSMAMIPLDGRRGPAHPTAVELFRSGRANLSLCVHGNDHDGPELGKPQSPAEGLAPATQALRRVDAFERRTGLVVDRVMVPPHERLSEAALQALALCDYEAFCGARSYPWIAESPDLPWLTRPAAAGPLVGWGSSELMPGCFPWLMRMDFGHPREELVIRAFLGQPLIVYGHHDLLENGTGALEDVAGEIIRLGDVRWGSLASIARSAAELRRVDQVLEVRMLGRHVCVDVPEGVNQVRVDAAALAAPRRRLLSARRGGASFGKFDVLDDVRIPVAEPCRIELRLEGAFESQVVSSPRGRLVPLGRRIAAEWRDRSVPLLTTTRR